MASESKTTTDHKAIQAWSEARGGKPATVKSTEKDGEAGVLRIDFPGYSGAGSLEEISWEEFFKKFDEKNLAFLYQEHTSSGEESRFFKLVSRDTSSAKSSSEHQSTKTEHKDESKSTTKAEHSKEDSKSSAKAESKEDSKTHKPKAERKEDSKSTAKAEHKEDSKAHKAEEKPHKTTKK